MPKAFTPKRILVYSRAAWWARIVSNISLILAGAISLYQTPQSIETFGITGILAVIWVAMLVGGASLSIIGTWKSNTLLESIGPSIIAGGFVIWAICAVTQPDAPLIYFTVGLVFISYAAMQLCLVSIIPAVEDDLHG